MPTKLQHQASSVFYGQDVQEVVESLKDENVSGDHFLTAEQLEVVYRTNVKTGLTDAMAQQFKHQYGPNKLVELAGTSKWKILRHNLCGWFQIVLWVGALLNFLAYFITPHLQPGAHEVDEYLYLGIIIVTTVVGTGLFGFYQEAKNVSVMSGFEQMVPPDSTVIREGIKQTIPNEDVTIGDIVEVKGGDIVPADIVIVQCTSFSTDMSSLTGESEPIQHSSQCTDPNPLESKNMAYFGCPALEGSARGVVVNIGEMTQVGKIAGLVSGLAKEPTPIAREITHFVKLICAIAFVLGIIFFILVFSVKHDVVAAFQYMLGIVLANVPEGLIVTLTVCMTLSAKALLQKNCLAKSLQAVETLGSTSCICSDKTGTLTMNRMTVSHLFCNFNILDHTDKTHIEHVTYNELMMAACLNLKAVFTHDTMHLPISERKILGDASESAILRYMEENRSVTTIERENPRIAEIPFSSAYKYQVTVHVLASTQNYYLIMKGAPEIIMNYCSSLMTDNGIQELTNEHKRDLKENLMKLANMGERVIGYCDLHIDRSKYPEFNMQTFPLANLVFIGALSLIDPPRPNIEKYIGTCREAGIRVVMVTGDHPVTALAISRKCGIITKQTAYDYAFKQHIDLIDVPAYIAKQFKAAIITGDDLHHMTTNELKEAQTTYDEITFARTSPQQKLFIVESFQELGYVVAVTGDGVNDSPALKKADIGIAMGITGTEVSKRAADMILLDDSFSSIVLGVQEGRKIFDNLKKTIAYTLTSNTPEMLPFVVYACLGMPLPLTLMLILVINVGTDLMPAMSLAYEDSEEDIMSHPPRKLTDRLVDKVLLFMAYFQIGFIQFFGGMFSYFVTFADAGFFPSKLFFVTKPWDNRDQNVLDSLGRPWGFRDRKRIEKRAQTAYFVAICLTQVSDVIICKTRRVSLLKKGMRNHVLNLSIIVNLVICVIVVYVPFCNKIFGTEPLHLGEFFLGAPFFILMILLDELRRYLIRNGLSKWIEKETYY